MESQTKEWKESWDKECLKTICAFANTDGGVMTIGVKDNGDVVGVRDPQKLLKVISDTIKNKIGIMPSVKIVDKGGKVCITITVKREDRRIDMDGIFYKRSGSTTHRVTGEELKSWIMEEAPLYWTDMHAKNVKIERLSQEAIKFFVKKGLSSMRMSPMAAESSTETLLRNYELMDDEGLRNSAAILFLENPAKAYTPASVKIGDLSESGRLLRHDEVDCPLVFMPDRVMDLLLNKYLRGVDDIVGLMRVTKYPYPEKALREAVMNAIIHRNYWGVGLTYVRVYPDRIEISNPGRLPHGWTKKNLFNKHSSVPLNPSIAHVFYDMGYVERWGSGIEMMRDECRAMNLPDPEYNITKGNVEIVFRLAPKEPVKGIPEKADALDELTAVELDVYNLIAGGDVNTQIEMAELLNVSVMTLRRATTKLTEMGLIERTGSKKSGKWVVKTK